MSFNWTYPDPLDPSKPSLIGGKLRNVIPTLAIYIQEICDAIDFLREAIGQQPYIWHIYRPEVGDKLLYEHYSQIQLRLDALILDYKYTSVKDILERDWSDYEYPRYNSTVAGWQIIQDFRDVCDALLPKMETWEVSPIPITYNSIICPATSNHNEVTLNLYSFEGTLGTWEISEEYLGLCSYFFYINNENLQMIHPDGQGTRHNAGVGFSDIQTVLVNDNIKLKLYAFHLLQTGLAYYSSGEASYKFIGSAPNEAFIFIDLKEEDNIITIETDEILKFEFESLNYQYSRYDWESDLYGTSGYKIQYPISSITFTLTDTNETKYSIIKFTFTNDPSLLALGTIFSTRAIRIYLEHITQDIEFAINDYMNSYLENTNRIIEIGLTTYVPYISNLWDANITINLTEPRGFSEYYIDNIGLKKSGI